MQRSVQVTKVLSDEFKPATVRAGSLVLTPKKAAGMQAFQCRIVRV